MNFPHDMNCRELIEFLADYLDNSLPDEQAREFQRHLSLCPSCVAYLDSYQTTIKLGKAALASPATPDCGKVPEGLVDAIREARKTHPK